MIQLQTILYVADNSGAKKVMCIKVLGHSKKQYANIGDIIKISIKDSIPKSKCKKGDILNAVIIRTKKGINRKDGTKLKFNKNYVVLLNNDYQPIGTRVFGPVTYEIKNEKFSKIISMSDEVL